jgi:uncharacterized protein YecE (DUF72 family)
MGQTFIGTGGWAYFNVPSLSPLRAYSKAFNYVEVNSTFYKIPLLREVKEWRRSVPGDFHFAVRAHKSITHEHPFEDSEATHSGYRKMLEICRILRADILHLQLPPSTIPDGSLAKSVSNFLSSHAGGSTCLALELRGEPPLNDRPDLQRLMQDRGIIHCVDPLKGQTPANDGDTLYARLFGRGYHNLYQPTDDELKSLDDLASGFNRAFLTFHGARMYSDAARLRTYKVKGNFPQLTKTVGLDSLREVLAEDARFPATKAELSRDQGWKLFESFGGKRLRAGELLALLPEGTYSSPEDVLKAVKDRGLLA